jgi:nanoRNase/pAp phosphatase (c-di-AMP/oligoRNAs hydrolase)
MENLHALLDAVRGANRVLILLHNDPDPDAIASGLALRYLLEQKLGLESDIVYRGIVGRAENKALLRYLGEPIRLLADADFDQSVPVALVDTQPGAGNNALPAGQSVALVLDHHPLREDTARATFADIRSDIGASSTILAGYLRAAEIDLPLPLITALFYGIKTDTMALSRGAKATDVSTYFDLQAQVDIKALGRIERAQVPAAYFESIVAALRSARIYEHVLISRLDKMSYPDLVAEIADLLLRLEGIQWAICIGVYGQDLVLSARTTNESGGAGDLVSQVVGDQGSAGGHGMMAGGQMPLADRDPELLILQLVQRVLRSLDVSSEAAGCPLV